MIRTWHGLHVPGKTSTCISIGGHFFDVVRDTRRELQANSCRLPFKTLAPVCAGDQSLLVAVFSTLVSQTRPFIPSLAANSIKKRPPRLSILVCRTQIGGWGGKSMELSNDDSFWKKSKGDPIHHHLPQSQNRKSENMVCGTQVGTLPAPFVQSSSFLYLDSDETRA